MGGTPCSFLGQPKTCLASPQRQLAARIISAQISQFNSSQGLCTARIYPDKGPFVHRHNNGPGSRKVTHVRQPPRHQAIKHHTESAGAKQGEGCSSFERCLKLAHVQWVKDTSPDGSILLAPRPPRSLTQQAWKFALTRLATYTLGPRRLDSSLGDEREITRQVMGAARALQLFNLLPKFLDYFGESLRKLGLLAEVAQGLEAMRRICATSFFGMDEDAIAERFAAGTAGYQALLDHAASLPLPKYRSFLTKAIVLRYQRGEQLPDSPDGQQGAACKRAQKKPIDSADEPPICHPGNYFLGQICLQIPEISNKARAYLQANDALLKMAFSAGQSTREYRVESPWNPLRDERVDFISPPACPREVNSEINKKLLRSCGFGDLHPNRVQPLFTQYNDAINAFMTDRHVLEISSYLPSETAYNGPAPRKETICVDPAGKMLPNDVIAHAQRLLGMARQRRKQRTDADRVDMAALGSLMDAAKSMRAASQAEQLISSEVMYLVEHATELHDLHDRLTTVTNELHKRWALQDQITKAAPAAQPRFKKGQPAAQPEDPTQRAVPPTPQQPGPPQPAGVPESSEACTHLAPLEPVRQLTWCGVQMWSRLCRSELVDFVERNFDAGTFTTAAESLRWHLRKHALAKTPVEDYITQAKQAYRSFYAQEVGRRAQNPQTFVQVIRHPEVFAVYAWDGRVITFCDKKRCGIAHFPTL